MKNDNISLARIFDGWNGYQTSLVNAIAPLTPNQFAWRGSAKVRSVGELARHISSARIFWFARMGAVGSAELESRIDSLERDDDFVDTSTHSAVPITQRCTELVDWLQISWRMIADVLDTWSVADLWETYPHEWRGQVYAASRQWTIWRIMAHDIHHGGQISRMLAMQGIDAFELRDLGGHIVLPPLAAPPTSPG